MFKDDNSEQFFIECAKSEVAVEVASMDEASLKVAVYKRFLHCLKVYGKLDWDGITMVRHFSALLDLT